MSYDKKQMLEQAEANADELYALFFGYSDVQPIVQRICAHLRTKNLNARYTAILDKILNKNDRIPKLAIVIFAIWLCPELKLGENAQPRRFEPFQKDIHRICMNMLEGRHLSVQDFVTHALTDYLVTPRK